MAWYDMIWYGMIWYDMIRYDTILISYHIMSNCNVPAAVRNWVDSTLRVAIQCSNQFSQRIRPASKRVAGRLGCHIPLPQWHQTPLSDNPPLSPGQRHDNQPGLSECAGLYPGMRASPQCNVPAGIRTWVDSTFRVTSQRLPIRPNGQTR